VSLQFTLNHARANARRIVLPDVYWLKKKDRGMHKVTPQRFFIKTIQYTQCNYPCA